MLKCYNDGKEKSQSFEVWDSSYLFSDIEKGFGCNIDEAFNNYILNIENQIVSIQNYLNKVNKDNIVMVNWNGNPLDSK